MRLIYNTFYGRKDMVRCARQLAVNTEFYTYTQNGLLHSHEL